MPADCEHAAEQAIRRLISYNAEGQDWRNGLWELLEQQCRQ